MASESDYKELHEQFVSGSEGGTLASVISIGLLTPLSIAINAMIFGHFHRNLHSPLVSTLVNYSTLFLPIILWVTVLNEYATLLTISLAVFSAATLARKVRTLPRLDLAKTGYLSGTFPFLSFFRSYTLIASCIMILAVDFQIFPRELAKTETYGISVMDIGVACFTFMAGVTSKESRGRRSHFNGIFSSNIILILVGIGRCVSVKLLSYQEHITEYGVHWNFFLTLAAVRFLTYFLYQITHPSQTKILFFIIMSTYQFLLYVFPIEAYILDERRDLASFLDSNREGLISLVGYVLIFLAGVLVGQLFFQRLKFPRRARYEDINEAVWKTSGELFFICFFCLFFVQILSYFEMAEPSRRVCNPSYVLLSIGLVLSSLVPTLLLDFYVIERLKQSMPPRVDFLSKSGDILLINHHGMAYFLAGNLLTGLFNMALPTIFLPDFLAFIIIIAYQVALIVCIRIVEKISLLYKVVSQPRE